MLKINVEQLVRNNSTLQIEAQYTSDGKIVLRHMYINTAPQSSSGFHLTHSKSRLQWCTDAYLSWGMNQDKHGIDLPVS